MKQLIELIGEGGQARVFAHPQRPKEWVVKVPHKPLTEQVLQRWLDLIELGVEQPGLAWPKGIWSDEHGKPAGLVLPRIVGENLLTVFNPRSRLIRYPGKQSTRGLISIAQALANRVNSLHDLDIVVGDVQPANALLSDRDATLWMIDLDSASFTSKAGRKHDCEVGQRLYLPPESLTAMETGAPFHSKASDAYALANLIFHILLAGRHPMAGVPISPKKVVSTEEAALNGWYPYVPNKHVGPPELAPRPNWFGREVATLFVRAFIGPAASRPTPSEWVQALERAKKGLIQCSKVAEHAYDRSMECPWCQLESRGVHLFRPKLRTPNEAEPSLRIADPLEWLQLSGFLKELHQPLPRFEENIDALNRARIPLSRWLLSPRKTWTERRQCKVEFASRMNILKRQVAELELLSLRCSEYSGVIKQAKRLHQRQRAWEKWSSKYPDRWPLLETVPIARTRGVGPATLQLLRAAGVHTAFDIDPTVLRSIQGIGADRQRSLLKWQEAKWAMNATRPASPGQLADLLNQAKRRRLDCLKREFPPLEPPLKEAALARKRYLDHLHMCNRNYLSINHQFT